MENIKFKLTQKEAEIVAELLAHCRLSTWQSETNDALNSLIYKFEEYMDDSGVVISFTKEKPNGFTKTWGPDSKSTITIEVE